MAKSKDDSYINSLDYQGLVDIVRSNCRSKKNNSAYNEIENRIRPKIYFIARQFYIPGCNHDDIFQEALFALRYKAIPDYDGSRGRGDTIYPFDKFAVLCIRRHLSTLLKSSFQNKRKALNTSLSLDQDRNNTSDDSLFLSDIIPRTEGSVVGELGEREYYQKLFKGLYLELSILEKRVFKLYSRRYSYGEISIIINKYYRKKKIRKRTNVKSIDNALSRIKQKAKEVYDRFGIEDVEDVEDLK